MTVNIRDKKKNPNREWLHPYKYQRENIETGIFDCELVMTYSEAFSLYKDYRNVDFEDLIRSIETPENLRDWKHLKNRFHLPAERLLVVPVSYVEMKEETDDFHQLRTAIILSKCNNNFYLPDGPMIFSHHRLERHIKLVKINLNGYYEMD